MSPRIHVVIPFVRVSWILRPSLLIQAYPDGWEQTAARIVTTWNMIVRMNVLVRALFCTCFPWFLPEPKRGIAGFIQGMGDPAESLAPAEHALTRRAGAGKVRLRQCASFSKRSGQGRSVVGVFLFAVRHVCAQAGVENFTTGIAA
jgi:hypothetical protein